MTGSFTNPAAGASAAGGAYVQALLDLLGRRDPFRVMEELEAAVRPALAGVAPDLARRPEAPGKWSLLQIVGHLVDTEIVYGYRARLIVAEDRPRLPGYDQDLWSTRLHHDDVPAEEAIADLGWLRRLNLRFTRRLDDGERERWGVHSERGEESVGKIVRLLAAHDLVHRRQLQRVRRSLGLPATESP